MSFIQAYFFRRRITLAVKCRPRMKLDSSLEDLFFIFLNLWRISRSTNGWTPKIDFFSQNSYLKRPKSSTDLDISRGRNPRKGSLSDFEPRKLNTMSNESPLLAGHPGQCCIQSVKHTGTPVGKIIKIADVDTYISEPPQGIPSGSKKAILYLADVFGPLFVNAKLLQDYFASHGYLVLGLDYFFGDPIDLHSNDPNFDREAWFAKSTAQAREALPKWFKAVRETYGADTQYSAVGYCFGAPYVLELGATDDVVAAAFAHPARITEDHFKKLKKPLLLLCAETDAAFPIGSRRRAEDILVENKATYHIQVFSGVAHGFATKGDPTVETTRWAKEQAARGVIEWFDRFNNK